MNPKALQAVLSALQKKCYDDMADTSSSPDEKLEDAVDMAGHEDDEEDFDENEVDAPEMAEEDEVEADPNDLHAALKEFMRPTPKKPEAGTAVMIAMDKKKPGIPGRFPKR